MSTFSGEWDRVTHASCLGVQWVGAERSAPTSPWMIVHKGRSSIEHSSIRGTRWCIASIIFQKEHETVPSSLRVPQTAHRPRCFTLFLAMFETFQSTITKQSMKPDDAPLVRHFKGSGAFRVSTVPLEHLLMCYYLASYCMKINEQKKQILECEATSRLPRADKLLVFILVVDHKPTAEINPSTPHQSPLWPISCQQKHPLGRYNFIWKYIHITAAEH